MVKKLLILCFAILLFANEFDTKCEACHKKRHIPLKPIFFNYLLYHSSKRLVLKAMRDFLLHPDPKKSLLEKNMPPFKHKIGPKELENLLQIYWNRYKVIGKIR